MRPLLARWELRGYEYIHYIFTMDYLTFCFRGEGDAAPPAGADGRKEEGPPRLDRNS